MPVWREEGAEGRFREPLQTGHAKKEPFAKTSEHKKKHVG